MTLLKRLLISLLTCALFVGLCPVSVSAEEEEIIMHGIGFVTMPYQQLYSKADADSEALAVTSEHDCVIIIEEKNDSWYKVIYNLQEGYMYDDALDIRTEVHAELGDGIVNSDIVYFRSGPGTEHEVLTKLPTGTNVIVAETLDGWVRLRFLNEGKLTEGYASADYITVAE